jgi:glyoxylase-like metal-dependent hydrolase (beta-lactamase superfamily II)
MDYALKIGFPAETLAAIRARFKYAFAPGLLEGRTVRLVRDRDELSVGAWRLRCLHTPGHSEGHLCLYEPGRKLFFSGDHLMDRLPPMILLTRFGCDALGLYLAGLERLGKLETALVLPGHGPAFTNLGREIRGVLAVHEQRLAWFKNLARSGAITPLEAAPRMSWRRRLAHWDQADDISKWLGLTEALAYLWRLKRSGRLEFDGIRFQPA